MYAVVCGKRSILEEFNSINGASPSSPSSPSPSSASFSKFKKIRCCSPSLSPPRPHIYFSSSYRLAALIQQLSALFPDMSKQLLEKTLEECGDDLDLAIHSLTLLRLGSSEASALSNVWSPAAAIDAPDGRQPPCENATYISPADGSDWVELLVGEMMNASTMDDAKARASRALVALEKSISTRAVSDASNENMMLKEQVQSLINENGILKRAVALQFERQKEFENRNQELQQLKQLLSQYKEQLKTLEVNNYALSMHLKQAQQSSSIPGRFYPDVF